MARRTTTAWVSGLAAAALAACGAASEESATFGADTSEPEQQALDETEGVEPDVPSEDNHEGGTDPDEPGKEAREADLPQDSDDGETPWRLLPDEDRPAPVERPTCDRASPTLVAC